MLVPRIIPCLDMKAGRIVKGVQFQGLRDVGDPVKQSLRYCQSGADELIVLDVSATIEERKTALDTIREIREMIRIPLTVGGGVRSLEDAKRLLEAGADKVAVNSAAVKDPDLITQLADAYGSQCVVLSVDAMRDDEKWVVATRAGTQRHEELSVAEWASKGEQRGAGEILLTSWDRDGSQAGYDLGLIQAVRSATRLPIVASGGAKTAGHMIEALEAGANAVLAASIFHENQITVNELKIQMTVLGMEVRPC